MAEALLTVEGVQASYGPIHVLHGVSLTVQAGEIVTLIGANGAGKSTLLQCIAGVHRPTAGRIAFKGREIGGLAANEVVALGLALVPEGRRIFPRMTVLENLQMGAYLRRDSDGVREDLQRMYQLFPILRERVHQSGGTLSGGEQQMLAIARALMSRPSLVLMDEPSMGVAPILVARIFDTIRELNRAGTTVLLVEQNAHLALRVASRGYVMETGRIILEDRAATLLEDPRVQEAYLGE